MFVRNCYVLGDVAKADGAKDEDDEETFDILADFQERMTQSYVYEWIFYFEKNFHFFFRNSDQNKCMVTALVFRFVVCMQNFSMDH